MKRSPGPRPKLSQHRILTHYLPLYFPEIDRFRGNSRSDWFFAFLDAFPTPASITTLKLEAFVAGAWDVVGRKVSKTQILMDIYETARTSIGLPFAAGNRAIGMFRMVIAEARSLIRQRNEIETQADELLRHSKDYLLLRQIPGIGPINALTIIAEAGDLRRFHHHRQFLKFCGLDLSTQQSGQYRGQTRLSKFGNARLRRTLWLAGQVAIRQRENGYPYKFERYIARDRDNPDLRRKAMTAITAKMARVVHAVVKGDLDYRPLAWLPAARLPMWAIPALREGHIQLGLFHAAFGYLGLGTFVEHGNDGTNHLKMTELFSGDIEKHVLTAWIVFSQSLRKIAHRGCEFSVGTAELL